VIKGKKNQKIQKKSQEHGFQQNHMKIMNYALDMQLLMNM